MSPLEVNTTKAFDFIHPKNDGSNMEFTQIKAISESDCFPFSRDFVSSFCVFMFEKNKIAKGISIRLKREAALLKESRWTHCVTEQAGRLL